MNKEIHQLNGVKVDGIKEGTSKNGKTYYTFEIGGKKMSCWDKNIASAISVGQVVNVQYSVNGNFSNIESIYDATAANNVEVEHVNIEENVVAPQIEQTPLKNETVKKLQSANSEDELFSVIAAEVLNIVGRVYDSHYVKEADVPIRFGENWINAYGETLKVVYDKALEVRKEKLGY